MITCYNLDDNIYNNGIAFNNLETIYSTLKNNLNILNSTPVEALILILDKYSKRLTLNKEILKFEGVSFLSFFLKKSNIENLVNHSLSNKKYLNDFIEKENGFFVKAQGRGVVCHWIAGNVPTLCFYSAFQSILAKNTNIIRVPKENINIVLKLLSLLENIEINYEDKIYSSKILLKNISIIYFDSNNKYLNKEMSVKADARVIWGGNNAVNSISTLPKKTTCKDLIFGPKYSFAIFDKTALESKKCEKYLENLVMDIAVFNQEACSSPHVLFVEKSNLQLSTIVKNLSKAFEKIEKRHPNVLSQSKASKVINERGLYGLSLDKDLYCNKSLNYTILMNDELCLEEPIGGRTLFIKIIDNMLDVVPLITNRVQTIGIACEDKNKVLKFANAVTCRGVDRVVDVGLMNIYDSPWDGYYMIYELVRWCSLNIL